MEIKNNPAFFYEKIKILCKQKKISQIELCEKTGINLQSHKNRIVRNVFPDVNDALKMAQYLDTSVEFLLTGEQKDTSDKSEKIIEEISQVLERYR